MSSFKLQPYAVQHESPSGPGDTRPTALQVLKDEGLIGKLNDKTILITGCNAGLGLETARALHATGAKLFITARDQEKGNAAIKDIMASSTETTLIELVIMDLSDFSSVRAAATEFLGRSPKLNVLVANAGIMAWPESRTVDGLEMQFGVNHFAHFLFFQLLKPLLMKSSSPSFASRIVTVSSWGHHMSPIHFDDMFFEAEGSYNKWVAYGQSKTANIYMANSIERHYGAQGLHALSLHPGGIFTTELARNLTPEDFAAMGGMSDLEKVGKSPDQGAATQVWAAVSPCLEGRGGLYLSDVGVAEPSPAGEYAGGPGYAIHAYDEESEEKLWKLSFEVVGLIDGQ